MFADPVADELEIVTDLPPAYIPPIPVARRPDAPGPQLDAWTRETQRHYLRYLIGAIARITYRESSIANARHVLMKLNGIGGEW